MVQAMTDKKIGGYMITKIKGKVNTFNLERRRFKEDMRDMDIDLSYLRI